MWKTPKEECVKQHYMVVCNFSVHISHVKKRRFSPRIRTCKLRDPATASLSQSPFKVKQWLHLQLPPLPAQMAIMQVAPCWMLPPKCVVSQRPTVETRNLVVEWRGGQSYTREACTAQVLQCPEVGGMVAEAKRAKLPTFMPNTWQTCHLAGKVWGGDRGIRHSIPRWWWFFFTYRQKDGLQKTGHRWWELCT